MRPLQNLLMKAAGSALIGPVRPMLRRSPVQCSPPCRYVQRMDNFKRKTSSWQSMRDFFMHPLTWDRNNGYLNLLLALAIFTFVFINSCSPCPEDRVPDRSKTSEK